MKKLNVLVIDDVLKNIEEAKTMFNSWQGDKSHFTQGDTDDRFSHLSLIGGMNVLESYSPHADFAQTGEEAQKHLNAKQYDIILTDLFYDHTKTDTPQAIRQELASLLSPYGAVSTDKLEEHHLGEADAMKEAAKGWIEGTATPPYGVKIADSHKKNSVCVINTLVHHHLMQGEPAHQWVLDNDRVAYYDEAAMQILEQHKKNGGEFLEREPGKIQTLYDLIPEKENYAKTWSGAMKAGIDLYENQ